MKNKILLFCLFMQMCSVTMAGQVASRVGKFIFEKSGSFLASHVLSPSFGFLGKKALPYFFPAVGALLPFELTGSTFLFGLKKDGLVDRYLPFILAGTGFALVAQKPYITGTFLTTMYLYYRKKKNKQAEELKKKFESEKENEIKMINYTHEKEKEKLSNSAIQEKNNLIKKHEDEKITLENNLNKLHEEEKSKLMKEYDKAIELKNQRLEELINELREKEKITNRRKLTDEEIFNHDKVIMQLKLEITNLKNKIKDLKSIDENKKKPGFLNLLFGKNEENESEEEY